MAKKRTSKKQDFLFENMPAFELKTDANVKDYKASDALIQCLQDGDSSAFKEILGSYLDVVNKSSFAKKTHIPERTLYRMVSDEGNPTLDNIARVVHALCI